MFRITYLYVEVLVRETLISHLLITLKLDFEITQIKLNVSINVTRLLLKRVQRKRTFIENLKLYLLTVAH